MKEQAKNNISAVIRLFFILFSIILLTCSGSEAGDLSPIKLKAPDKTRGLAVMEALSVRASVRNWADKELSIQDLSDMLWAAHGVNRPDGKRTAPSARDSHDIDIYVFKKDGIYVYDAADHVLNPVASGDYRDKLGKPPWFSPPPTGGDSEAAPPPAAVAPSADNESAGVSTPPTLLFLVSDISRFDGDGTTENKVEWAGIDAGIVSQNVSIFCAATGLKTRPRSSFSRDDIRKILNLKKTQYPLLNMPIGYPVE